MRIRKILRSVMEWVRLLLTGTNDEAIANRLVDLNGQK